MEAFGALHSAGTDLFFGELVGRETHCIQEQGCFTNEHTANVCSVSSIVYVQGIQRQLGRVFTPASHRNDHDCNVCFRKCSSHSPTLSLLFIPGYFFILKVTEKKLYCCSAVSTDLSDLQTVKFSQKVSSKVPCSTSFLICSLAPSPPSILFTALSQLKRLTSQ